MHFPFPLSPLTASAQDPCFSAGSTQAAREYRSLIDHVDVMSRNLYRFWRLAMARPANEDEGRQMGEAAEAAIEVEGGRLLERWHEEHLPALQTHLRRLRELETEPLAAAQGAAVLDELDTIHRDLWVIHFRIVLALGPGMQRFDDFYADIFGGEEGDGHALLVGVESESVRAGFGLSDLAILANDPGLASLFRDTPLPDLLARLTTTDSGQTFLDALGAYLEGYGRRQDLIDFMTPTWLEDPTFALSAVRNYVQTGYDARTEYAATQRSAADALAAVREQLAAYPAAVREMFEELLQVARAAVFLKEEHNYYIDQQAFSSIRLVYLRMGRALAENGMLRSPDDVFMLRVDELPALFTEAPTSDLVEQVRSIVHTRRAQMRIAQTLTPPPFIGPAPTGPPPADGLMARARLRMYGGPSQDAAAANEVRGSGGSRGVATGVARVARTLEEATAIRPGEILVTVTTMPAWTPLFGVVAAVVTETGGPLSHCAIVAREYGVPAVVGASGATRAISTGQRITVDGGRGIVTIDD